jgi:amino acid transporter
MKRIYHQVLSFFTLLFLFLQTRTVYADICPDQFKDNLCALKPSKTSNIVSTIVTTLLMLAIILALIFLVYGGIKWITSGGDKAKLDSARSHITASIVGLIIALLALAIVNLISFMFTGQMANNFKLPTLLD